jgi:predicted permease
MRLIDQATALWRALFRNARVDADLADEMRFHIEREVEANIAHGMTPDAARRAARLTFGSVDAAQEQARDERPGTGVRQAMRDVRFGARLLLKSPGFAITSVLIVALGIGAATAIFSVVNGVLLHPLPYREPDRLVTIWLDMGGARALPSAADYVDLRALDRVYDDVALMENINLNLVGDGEPQRLNGAEVSPHLFSMLGVSAALGRTFAVDEDQPGRERVILLGNALWHGRFGGDSGVIGRQLRINDASYTVIGVMPKGFRYPTNDHEAWVPSVLDPRELARELRDNYRIVARLAPGVSLELARTETAALADRLASTYASNQNIGMTVDAMLADAVRDVRPALVLLLGAVGFLLLIACVNLSNLFGARASARRAEFALRLALGASRRRLVAQAVAEAVPVMALGGLLGLVAASGAVRAFIATAPVGLPRAADISLSLPVGGVSLLLLLLVGLAASIAPTVEAWRSDFTSAAQDGGRSSTSGRGRSTMRRMGIAAQVAFTLPLLVGASLLVRSALNVARVDLGFRPEQVATLSFEVSRTKHPQDTQVADYYARLVEAVGAVPGVTHAGLVNRIPLSGGQTHSIQLEKATGMEEVHVDSRTVTPDYFATMGIALKAGRAFTERDDATAPVVGVIDERLAQATWPGESAVGKRFRGPGDQSGTVVGVVAHVRTTGVDVDPLLQVYWSYQQWTQDRMVLAVRSGLEPDALIPAVIAAIRSVDADQAVYQVLTMPELVDRSLAQRRLTTTLVLGFSVIALCLAAAGIYGVIAYGVAQRMREFGIRIALGADPGDVTRLVVWQGASMALAGAAVGLVLAAGAAGLMRGLVYGVVPRDVASMLGATALLVLCAALASYIPARRAARADPGQALRAE